MVPNLVETGLGWTGLWKKKLRARKKERKKESLLWIHCFLLPILLKAHYTDTF
jgi:hypothetical protein